MLGAQSRRLGRSRLERFAERGRGTPPVCGNLLQRDRHGVFDGGRHGVASGQDRHRLFGHHLGHDRLRGRPGERRLAGEHLVEHAAEAVHVGARVEVAFAHRLFGAHVLRRAEGHAGLGHPGAARLARGERDAEVRHQGAAVVQEDVLGLDVAMDHAMAMGVVERAGNFARDSHGAGNRELLLATHAITEGLAINEGHDVEEERIGGARVEQREDVRMLQVRRGLDLGQEPFGADHGGEFGAQHLDGHAAIVAQVLGEIHGRHPAGAEFALDAIAVGKGRCETGQVRQHAVPGSGRRALGGPRRVVGDQSCGRQSICGWRPGLVRRNRPGAPLPVRRSSGILNSRVQPGIAAKSSGAIGRRGVQR